MSATGAAVRRFPTAVLAGVGLAWAAAIAAEATGHGERLHHDGLLEGGVPGGVALGLFVVAWQLMIVAMMLPSSLPLVRLFDRATSGQPARVRAAFLGGYAAVWTGFGIAAFAGDAVLHESVERFAWLQERTSLVAGGVLLLAGAVQFSKLKKRCLTVCRHPAAFLMRHYRRGTGAAFALGARHGAFCVGCCWALMLIAFAAGVTNLAWMALLAGVMAYEKTAPRGAQLAKAVGVGLIALGALTIAAPSSMPPVF